jgi:hypothetical protein
MNLRKIKLFAWILITVLIISACVKGDRFRNNSSLTMPIVWTVSGMERIGKDDEAQDFNPIELYAARGEYEPFQILIQAPLKGLSNVNIAVSDLSSATGKIISKKNITLYREHYVYVRQPSPSWRDTINKPLGAGWYADGLIPFIDPATQSHPRKSDLNAVPFDLSGQENQPIWVDVFIPRETQAGVYTGKYNVTSNQGNIEGKISLTVWNFELPLKPSLNSSFGLWEVKSKSAYQELLKHKVMPKDVSPEYQRELIDEWGLTSRHLGFWSGANVETGKMKPAPSISKLKAAVASHQKELLLYNHTSDEVDRYPALYEPLKQWARNLHEVGVANLVTMIPVRELYDDGAGKGRSAVDIWTVLPKMYDAAPDRIAEVKRKGDQVWSYNCLMQDPYSPKWQIDFTPINFRIQSGFISQSLGLSGLLYWRTDLWTADPWHDVQTYTNSDNYKFSGEGMLVYPGKQVGIDGIVPSMRLKWLREGIEDYEYVQILKRLGRGEWAMEVARTVGADWRNWSHDPIAVEAARQKLGNEINRLQ